MIRQKSWEEFRATGLFLFMNSLLHVFGWTIVFVTNEDKIVDCFPARTNFRGFAEEDIDKSYKDITNYLAENIEELKNEVL